MLDQENKSTTLIGTNIGTNSSLDKFAVAIIDALYQGDEERLRKVFVQLSKSHQEIFSVLIGCWHSDPSQNSKPFNELVSLCETSELVFPFLVLAEKALEMDDIKLHEHFVLKAFCLLGKRGIELEQRLIAFYEVVKIKGLIHNNNFDKALAQIDSLNTNGDKFVEGYCFYLLGVIYKLKSKRHHYKAKNYLDDAIHIFEVHQPNRYLLNLSNLQISLFLETPASKLSEIANEFTQLGCPREASLALAQYNYVTKFSKNGLVSHDSESNYERVGNYYFISESMKDALKRLSVIASGEEGNILIFGQEGTGKEVFANTIHKLSDRADKPFTAVNCSQLKDDLFEPEFFGYERGAFTSADKQKRGLLEDYNGGMIFLDEIGELSPQVQKKLLRLLQDGKFRRVGSNKEIEVDIRFIGATNREMTKMIQRDKTNRESNNPNIKDAFRSDLVSRFPWRITVPTLNNRREEITYLAEVFLVDLAKNDQFILDSTAKNYLLTRDYPSNIRSLKDFLRCAVAYARKKNVILLTEQILLDTEVFMEMDKPSNDGKEISLSFDEQVREFASNLLLNTLSQCRNNAKLAAQKLGIPLRTFYKRLEVYNLKFPKL